MSTASHANSFSSLNVSLVIHTTLKNEACHLFRALLRESTYLPDPASRTFISNLATHKFRKDLEKRQRARNLGSSLWSERSIRSSLKRGQDALKYLRRANAGHTRQLTSILFMTYGRTRNRRHELLSKLKSPAPPLTAESSSDTTSTSPPSQNDQGWSPSNLSLPLHALLRSQSSRPGNISPRGSIKRIEPKMPERNAWGRPMPIKRVENFEKRWLAETLNRVMPPLPTDEWERLRKLAMGEERWEGPVVRRQRARAGVNGDEGGDVGMKGEVYEGDRAMGDEGLRSEVEANGGQSEGERTYMTQGRVSRPHTLTPRFMRRMWGNVLRICPKMERMDEEGEGWKVQWMDVENEKDVEMKGGGQTIMTAMFAGVDVKGKVLR